MASVQCCALGGPHCATAECETGMRVTDTSSDDGVAEHVDLGWNVVGTSGHTDAAMVGGGSNSKLKLADPGNRFFHVVQAWWVFRVDMGDRCGHRGQVCSRRVGIVSLFRVGTM